MWDEGNNEKGWEGTKRKRISAASATGNMVINFFVPFGGVHYIPFSVLKLLSSGRRNGLSYLLLLALEVPERTQQRQEIILERVNGGRTLS